MVDDLAGFDEFGKQSEQLPSGIHGYESVPVFVNEFWTAKQRAGHTIHEVSYRACFKPALPRFYIERLTRPGGLVYDPFMGRGTTLVEAMLLGRHAAGCDISPVARIMVEPRLHPPEEKDVARRLEEIGLEWSGKVWSDLETFYHPDTLRELTALREYFLGREKSGAIDDVDRWIRMVAVNRLTGHSPGFFSVYTLPPNQAVTVESQRRINEKRDQVPPYRDVKKLIQRKSRTLLKEPFPLTSLLARERAALYTGSSDETGAIADESVDLVVTSPPFLDVVDYTTDNWLRGWFCGIDTKAVKVWQLRKMKDWTAAMSRVFAEQRRILKRGGWMAFEVGEIRGGKIKLEEHVLGIGVEAGLEPVAVMINSQEFTKTANCWGVTNSTKGTNTNRIVLFRKKR